MPTPFTWIYLIRDLDTGLYKVGRSDNPDERLKTLVKQATHQPTPNRYTLIEAWLCPESTERELHKKFEQFRIRGEWFDLFGLFIPSHANHERVWVWMEQYCSDISPRRWKKEDTLKDEMVTDSFNEVLRLRKEIEMLKEILDDSGIEY